MSRKSYYRPLGSLNRPGFTLAEASISVLLVGLLMASALTSLGASKRREGDTISRLKGEQLAGALMNEILMLTFQEPDTSVDPVFGPEPGESTGNRLLFDDVDDYANWTSSPPSDRSGIEIPGFSGWTSSVNVIWADPLTLGSTASINTDLKKITVTATKGGKIWASRVGYRSIGWVDTIPTPYDTTGNRAPIATATSPKLTEGVGKAVVFDASTSSDPDGDYLSYVWNYGDGTTGSGVTVSKTYTAQGNYTCTLTVYDGRGGVSTSSLVAVITP